VRVVAGTAGGLRLVTPAGQSTRPTSDRVREATFNALVSLGAVEDASFLDLFAGSGAMGVEALSRGAARATFVDRDERALQAVRTNLEHTRLADRATVVASDALRFLATNRGPFDVAVLDPPYAWTQWDELLAAVPVEFVVAESDREIDPGARWMVARTRAYGSTVVSIFRRSTAIEETST
jgi:16S rRNA (guanine966-N2)-methyltransferase